MSPIALYSIVALLVPVVVVAVDGWRCGRAGVEALSDFEDVKAAVLLGALWPLFLALVCVVAVAWVAGRLASR